MADLLDGTEKIISLARDMHVDPDKARRTAVSDPRKSRSVIQASATPWSASGMTSVPMARSRRS